MATYGSGQMLGSGINPESFKQDYSGFARAAEIQAQGLSNLGGSIAGAIKNYGEAKQERKKLDAGIKATVTGIESAIKMGDSLGIDVKSSLTPYLDKINDPNVTPTEAAAYAKEASSAISNILNFGMKANQLGMEEDQNIRAARIKQAQIDAEANKPGSLETIAVPGGTQQMIRNPQTGILEPIQIAEDINAALNLPSPQMSQQLPSGNGTAMDGAPGVLPSINDPMNDAAEAIAYANRMTGGRNDISNLSPVPTGVPANQPTQALRIDSLPSGAMPTTPRTPFGFTPTKESEQETYEQNVEAGGLFGQRNTKTGEFKAYPGQTGGRITKFNPETGQFEIIEGSAAGVKEEKQKMAKENAVDKAMGLMRDLNLLEKVSESMTPGVLGAAGRIVAEQIPATQQAETKDVIDRVNSTLTISGIQEMRANNPTGAALGSVSDKDMAVLRSSVTALKNAQSSTAFKRELVRLKNLQHDLVYGSERVLKSKLDKGEITESQFNQAIANAPIEYLDEQGEVRSRTVPAVVPSSNSESVYKKYLEK